MQYSINQHQLTLDDSPVSFGHIRRNFALAKATSKTNKVKPVRRYPSVRWLAAPNRETISTMIEAIRQL